LAALPGVGKLPEKSILFLQTAGEREKVRKEASALVKLGLKAKRSLGYFRRLAVTG
jgi:hypothetical protein